MKRLTVLLGLLALAPLAGCAADRSAEGAADPIAPQALAERLDAGRAPLVLDVRSEAEYRAGHVPGAVHIPHDELAARLGELPAGRDDEIVVHCQKGGRAARAEAVLREAGYTNVRDLTGHWQAWEAAGLPVE